MSEFGNESVTATLRVSEKSLEALLKLLKYILERNEKRIEKKLKKENYAQLTLKNNRQKAVEFIDEGRGYINFKKLLKSGEKLVPFSVGLNKSELYRFNKLAKIYGLSYSVIADKSNDLKIKKIREEYQILTGKQKKGLTLTDDETLNLSKLKSDLEYYLSLRENKIIMVRSSDLEVLKDITDRMNREIRLSDIDTEILRLQSKDSLNEIEKKSLENLLNERESIKTGEFESFNNKSNRGIIDMNSSNNSIPFESVSFDESLSRVTDLKYNQNTCVICERLNPSNYIVVESEQVNYQDRQFTNTEYKVFCNEVEQKCDEFSHGKFTHYSHKNGKNSSEYGDQHWKNMKNEMKVKGGFSDDVIIFSNEKDFENYRYNFSCAQNKIVIDDSDLKVEWSSEIEPDFNYNHGVEILESQLKEMGYNFDLSTNAIKDMNGNQIFLDSQHLNDSEIISNCEIMEVSNICEQISLYKELSALNTEVVLLENDLDNLVRSNGEIADINDKKTIIESTKEKISFLKNNVNDLEVKREKIKSVEIMEQIKIKNANTFDETISSEITQDKGEVQSLQLWEDEISDSYFSLDSMDSTGNEFLSKNPLSSLHEKDETLDVVFSSRE